MKIYLFTGLLFFQLTTKGQLNNYFRFQKTEGLSQNTAFKISQDRQGFLWIGTGDGLNRFDGAIFKTYKPSSTNKEGFITGRVIRNKIIEDDSERLWLSTETGLQYLDKRTGRFQYLLPFNDTFNYMNGSLYPIKQIGGKFWFGKIAEGFISYDIRTRQYQLFAFPGAKQKPLQWLNEKAVVDLKGMIWTCQEAGLFAFNTSTGQWKSFHENRKLFHLCLVGEILYLVAEDGILLFNIKDHSSRLIKYNSPGMKVRCITSDNHDAVWIGDAAGNIYKVDALASKLVNVGNINGNNGNIFPVYDLFFDASGILWIGTDGMGLLKANIRPPDFFQYPSKEKNENIFIKSIYEDPAGLIWLGTFGHGILQLDKSTLSVKPLYAPGFIYKDDHVDVVTFMKEDEFKNLWIGYGRHLYLKKKHSPVFTEISIPVTGDIQKLKVTGMDTCKEKRIITTTLCVFNTEINSTGKNTRLIPDSTLGDYSFMLPRGNGAYYFGYNESGLCLNTFENNRWKIKKWLVKKTGFKCVYNDTSRSLLWFGTDKGLMLYNPKTDTYKIFSEEDGLGNSFVYGIVESGGELWLSTNGGLCNVKIIPKNANDFPGIICRNYKQKDGLQADEFNTGAFLKGRDGTLYFGGINGITWFNPQSIQPEKKISRLAITQLTVNDTAADPLLSPEYINNLDLGHRQNNLFFQFRGLEYSNPTAIHYAYMLSGWDKDWIFSKTNNEVRYNNLLPGDYVFYVKATNVEGQWMNEACSVKITIRPPYWKTWWFYLLELLLVSAVVISITKIIAQRKLKKKIDKLERQKELYAERMRISQEMHDDIGAGLTQISLISESAKQHSSPGNNISNELQDISTTSRQLVDNIGEIIWALNPQQDKLDMLMIHLREQINKLMEYSTIRCSIIFPDDFPVMELNNQLRRNILLVTKEIVHNVIKHSQAKNVRVHAAVQQKELFFDIADDGIGFDPDMNAKGNGLRNIRQRIMESGGSLEIHSSAEKGTQYLYRFPLA